jgi:hypothetical protein
MSAAPGSGSDILIRKLPHPVRVSYHDVHELVPELYESHPNVRFFVHVGVSHLATCCTLEHRARKGPYGAPDVDQQTWCFNDDDANDKRKSIPAELSSAVDVGAIVSRLTAEG